MNTHTSIPMSAVQSAFAAEDAKRTAAVSNKQYVNLGQMPIGTNMLLRLLPRPDQNLLPFVTKYTINLKFAGIVDSDHDTDDEVSVRVPSMKTWDMDDYILRVIAPYWKGTDDEKNTYARPYYHRPTFIYGCFAVSLPYVEQQTPENIVRLAGFTRSVQDQVRNALSDPDLEYAPWDYVHGRDFRVTKTQQGQWANYTQSKFVLRESALTEEQHAAIEKYGLPDLDAEIGEPPTQEVRDIIKAMYHASVAGEPFQNKAWGYAFRAFGAYGSQDKPNTTQRGGKTTTNGKMQMSDAETDELMAKLHAKTQSRTKRPEEAVADEAAAD